VSRKRSEDDEEYVQDTKGEALKYVSKKAKYEDEKVDRGWGPTYKRIENNPPMLETPQNTIIEKSPSSNSIC
jgi:hypothetical protein